MNKYIVIYRGSPAAMGKMKDASPEEMRQGMESWMAWFEEHKESLVEMGTQLANGQKVTSEGVFPADPTATAYSILRAESMNDVVKMLNGHPHLEWADGCEIEVFESRS